MPDRDRSPWAHRRAPDLDPWREHDACGVGFVARASGERSHDILTRALQALARVAHRGAASTDNSGDGAGLLTQIPRRLLAEEAARLGLPLGAGQPFALGVFFLPHEPAALDRATAVIEAVLREEGSPVLGWRDVPIDAALLGPSARATCPAIRQAFVAAPVDGGRTDEDAWERALYLARRTIERRVADEGLEPFFACSLSCRTVVYKALLTGTQLPRFFRDFRSPAFETAIAVFHQRYSTNTLPSWPLAQPFRVVAHNGEINTLWGNRNAMRAREPVLASPEWREAVDRLKPVIWAEGRDSASRDNALELLVRLGRDPGHALMMLLPEAHEGAVELPAALRGFYEFHECLVEPWDGPAALAFTDGVLAGSALDRNGLRPCRYKITRDGLVIAGSEVGLVDLDPAEVVETGSLGPGELLVVDTRRKAVIRNAAAKHDVARRRPYVSWGARAIRPLRPATTPDAAPLDRAELTRRQLAFGFGFEDLRFVLEPMGNAGQDAVWSMGDDTPIPPLSRLPQSAYAFMRQRFAQVTNPPIDPLREGLVMSLRMHLGVGSVHQHLMRKGLSTRVGLVAEAGDEWDVHHFAALIGYGAEAVRPWLAFASVQALFPGGEGQKKFRAAAEKGLLKVLSKMGISTLSSYCGAQIFEALGLGAEVVDRCFTGTVSTIGGIGFAEIAEDILARQRAAYPSEPAAAEPAPLPDHGRVRYRRAGEEHRGAAPLPRFVLEAITPGTAPADGVFFPLGPGRSPPGPPGPLTHPRRH